MCLLDSKKSTGQTHSLNTGPQLVTVSWCRPCLAAFMFLENSPAFRQGAHPVTHGDTGLIRAVGFRAGHTPFWARGKIPSPASAALLSSHWVSAPPSQWFPRMRGPFVSPVRG